MLLKKRRYYMLAEDFENCEEITTKEDLLGNLNNLGKYVFELKLVQWGEIFAAEVPVLKANFRSIEEVDGQG